MISGSILDVKRYEEKEERLGVGERLVLYTDGVTEARNPDGEFFGGERLAELLVRYSQEPVNRLVKLVADHVDEFEAHQRQDDTTVLALHRNH